MYNILHTKLIVKVKSSSMRENLLCTLRVLVFLYPAVSAGDNPDKLQADMTQSCIINNRLNAQPIDN